MECLFFISFSSSILLACYDGTCYLDETLHCNMYVQLLNGCNLCVCATCYICMYDETYVLLNSPVKYIYICHIYLLWKLLDLKKTGKKAIMQALCRLPPTAKGSLPSAVDGKEATWQATVLPGRLTYLVSLPTVADGKENFFLPTAADGKGLPMFAVSGRWQRLAVNHLTE